MSTTNPTAGRDGAATAPVETPPAAKPAKEKLLTRFLMFEPTDATLLVWGIVGEILASDRDQAERQFYGDLEGGESRPNCPVSENAWQPRVREAPLVPKPRSRPLKMPQIPTGKSAGSAAATPGADDA